MKQILRALTYLVIIVSSIISCEKEPIEDINEITKGNLLIQRNIDPQASDNTSLKNALTNIKKGDSPKNQKKLLFLINTLYIQKSQII